MEKNSWANYKQWPAAESLNQNNMRNMDRWGKRKRDEKKTKVSDDGRKYKSLKVYIRDILRTSLITSFPEIAISKSWTKRIIKIIVFIMCLVGFIYQTLNFLWLYLSYPTVVNVLISNPFEIIQPAVTICNRNRQRRSALCTADGNECTVLSPEYFCKTYPKYCRNEVPPFTRMPYVNDLIQNEWYWEDEEAEAHNDSMIRKCWKTIEGKRNNCSKPYRAVPAVAPMGEPNICYSIESLWEKPNETLDVYPNTFIFELEIDSQPEEYMQYTEPVLIQVAIHDRRRLVNPYSEGRSLKSGVQYEATVSMTEKRLLPAPYNTNCTDYVKLWKENNGTGPLNDLMCIEQCKLETLKEKGLCIDKNVAYPHMMELCRRDEITTTADIIENCTKLCGQPCYDYTYEVQYEEVNNYGHVCWTEWCKIATINMYMYFKQFRVTKFQYEPKFESVEMFSYIGGYMGMWLGLSLVSLFDFFETISYLLYYPIGHLKWRNKKKKIKNSMTALKRNSYFGIQHY